MYTTAQAAKILGLEHDTVTQYAKKGTIRAEKPGRDYIISQEALDQFVQNRRKSGRPKSREV